MYKSFHKELGPISGAVTLYGDNDKRPFEVTAQVEYRKVFDLDLYLSGPSYGCSGFFVSLTVNVFGLFKLCFSTEARHWPKES